MPILIAAVVFATLLGLLNLLLSVAIVRRLREHATRPPGGVPAMDLLPVGAPLPAFSGSTISGEAVGPTAGLKLIAFLSTTCGVCREQLPGLTRYLTGNAIAPDAALVVVVGDAGHPVGREFADALDPVATVVREPFDGPVSGAFAARIFPAFYLVDGGVEGGAVRSAAIAVDGLAEPVPA